MILIFKQMEVTYPPKKKIKQMEVPCPLPVAILIKSKKSGFWGGCIRESSQVKAKRRGEGPGTVVGALSATNSCPQKKGKKSSKPLWQSRHREDGG